MSQSRDDLVDAIAIRIVSIIPSDRFGFCAAIFADGRTITARVDAVIVPQLFKLIEHFRPRKWDVEALQGFHASQSRIQVGNLVITVAISK